MPEVLDWRTAADPRALVHRAARALAEGEVVAFPTDTVYALAASALIPEAVEKLCRSKKRGDDGPPPLGRSSTVVRVNGDGWSILREGPVSAEELGQQTAILTVFVCTGNTCRSPLAEALFKKKLADRLGCPAEELPRRGFLVIS